MLAGLTFRKEPFFAGADNVDQLYKIARVLTWDVSRMGTVLDGHTENHDVLPNLNYSVRSIAHFCDVQEAACRVHDQNHSDWMGIHAMQCLMLRRKPQPWENRLDRF